MEAEALVGPVAPGPEGLAADLPCPGCEYNLRGLTVPRCPECGFTFSWPDVPGLLEARRDSGREQDVLLVVPLGLLFLFAMCVFLMTGEPVAALMALLPFAIVFVISAMQAGIELLIAWPCFSGAAWKRFRPWWEGVLIGYGLCAPTCLILGRPMIMLCGAETHLAPGSFPTWLLLFITAVESFLVQWWVVRRRCRQWEDPIPGRRLALACLVAKAFVAIPWSLVATGVMDR